MAREAAPRRRVLVETLAGILEGIAVDREISAAELAGLQDWLDEHADALRARPFARLRVKVQAAIEATREGRRLSPEHHAQLLDDCHAFVHKHGARHPTAREAFSRLQGMALGILADGRLDDEEIIELRAWLRRFDRLRTHFVFDAFFSMLDRVLADGVIDESERAQVRELCETFAAAPPKRRLPAGFTEARFDADGRPRPQGAEPRSAQPPPPFPDFPAAGPADFWTLDLETANADPTSVCAVGLARVYKGNIVQAGARLVAPGSRFEARNVRLHGIDASAVSRAAPFEQVWPEIYARCFAGGRPALLVAHNASFMLRCLSALMTERQLTPPPALSNMLCTLQLSRRVWPTGLKGGYKLESLAESFELTRPAHDPVAGARACAELALRLCAERGVEHPAQVATQVGVELLPIG